MFVFGVERSNNSFVEIIKFYKEVEEVLKILIFRFSAKIYGH